MTQPIDDDPFAPEKQIPLIDDAFARGQAALAAGDRAEAVRWLDRARRLSPNLGAMALSLASACLGFDNARAAELFQSVLDAHDVRDAWYGLAAARMMMGDLAAARTALRNALSRHAFQPSMAGLADQIAGQTGASGWCGLTGAGVLTLHGPETASIRFDDGVPFLGRSGAMLPPEWRDARRVEVLADNAALIGGPICPGTILALDGLVSATASGVTIRAWHPRDPETDPIVFVRASDADGECRAMTIAAEAGAFDGPPPLSRPRAGFLPWSALPRGAGAIRVMDRGGWDLPGSPVAHPDAIMRGRPPAVRMPGALGERTVVLRSRRAPRPDLLAGLIAAGERVVRWDGAEPDFSAPPGDVVLLDGDAVVPPGWLDRLRDAAYAAPDIGTVIPLSNFGTAAYPVASGQDLSWFAADVPARIRGTEDQRVVTWLDRLCRRANGTEVIDVPMGSSPCVFIRADCLAGAGGLPLCPELHARAGWRHVALTGLFAGAISPVRSAQTSAETLFPAQRRLDLARWRLASPAKGTEILITHDDGGGVAHQVTEAVRALHGQNKRAIVLRPAPGGQVSIDDGNRDRYPNLRFALPREKPALLKLLRTARPALVQLHHFLNLAPSIFAIIRSLDVPCDVHVHDYIWFCPRIALVGRNDRYCEEPGLKDCEACVAPEGSYLNEPIGPTDLVARSRVVLTAARRVIAPSDDTADRMHRHFPGLNVAAVRHEDDDALEPPPPLRG